MKVSVLFALGSILLLSGCASTGPYVTQHAVPQFDPANYNSFAILGPHEYAVQTGNDSLYRSAKMLVTRALRAKGLATAELESADLVFQLSGAAMPEANAASYGFFYAGYGWDWYPVEYQRSNMSNSAQGTAVISAYDNKTKELVWQGYAQASSNTSTISAELAMEAVKQIIDQFPGK